MNDYDETSCVSESTSPLLRCDCHEQGEHWDLVYYDSINHSSFDAHAGTLSLWEDFSLGDFRAKN